MDIVNYLQDIYGYNNPIFLKDIRIGRKSKTAIKQELYRAAKEGRIERRSNGIYYIKGNKEFGNGVTFRKILEKKFIYPIDVMEGLEFLFVEGYYSGMTFLNMIGISEQVPAILEVTTNKTSSNKRYYSVGNSIAIIRKARTKVDNTNCCILQFLDMFYFVSLDEVKKNKELLRNYIAKKGFSKNLLNAYLPLYDFQTVKKIVEGGLADAFN